MAGVGLRQRRWTDGSGLSVDWSNPMTDGLLLCVPGNGNPMVDLVAGRRFTTLGAHPLNYPTGFGTGSNVSSGSNGSTCAISSSDVLRVQPPCTVAWAGSQISAPSAYAEIFGIQTNDSNTDPWLSLAVSCNVDGTKYVAYTNDGGTGFYKDHVGSITVTTARKRTLVGVRKSTSMALWVDGVYDGERTSLGTSITYQSTAQMTVTYQSPAVDTGTAMVVGAIWARELTGNEIVAFNADPTQLFRAG